MELSERRDARRIGAAIVAAVLVHAGLFVAIPFLTSLDTAPLPDYGPVVVRVELPEAVLEPEPPAPAAAPVPEPEPQPAPAAKPAPRPAAKAAPAAKATPTAPVATAPAAPARAAGSAFRQAGAAAGTSASAETSVVTGPPPVTLPAVGTTTPGAGEQRSGEAVSLTSRSTGGTLDKQKLDQSLAVATAGGATGAAGTGGGTAAATGAKPGAGADVVWENPTAAEGREYMVLPDVKLPKSALDFVGEVRIYFAVDAEGKVTSATVKQGSTNPEVNNACLKAMLQASFTRADGAPDIKGMQVFTFAKKR